MRSRLAAVPRAGWLCALIAVANALAWAWLTPAFWVPDEIASTGYVQEMAETGRLPGKGVSGLLSEEQVAVVSRQPFSLEGKPSWNAESAGSARRFLEGGDFARYAKGESQYLSSYGPLYYAYEGIPYLIGRGLPFTDRLLLMRAGSALLAGLTVLFSFLFLRELLPRTRWAWTVGALALAFQPMFGFIGGGVSNDNMLFACAALTFWLLARAFNRGLDLRSAIAIGAAAGVGALTKPTMFGLFPGIALGLFFLILRRPAGDRRQVAFAAAAALVLMVLPYGAWVVGSSLNEGTSAASGVSTSTSSGASNMTERLSYLWQQFLPRLPFLTDQIPYYVPWEIYFKGFVGRFGWFEYGFGAFWYWLALGLALPIVGAAAATATKAARSSRRHLEELATYASMVFGMLLLVGIVAYNYHAIFSSAYFEQARYLFTLLPLFAAVVTVAAKSFGRRGPSVGAGLVVLCVGWSLAAQLLTVARFYT